MIMFFTVFSQTLKQKKQELENKLKTKSEILRKTQMELEDKVFHFHVCSLLRSLVKSLNNFLFLMCAILSKITENVVLTGLRLNSL